MLVIMRLDVIEVVSVTEEPHTAESHSPHPPGCKVHVGYSINWNKGREGGKER